MADYGTRQPTQPDNLPSRESRTQTVFSYQVAGGAQTAYSNAPGDSKMRRYLIKLNFKNFTAGRVMSVDVDVKDVDGAWNQFDTVDYTCNTAGENNPYIVVEHFDEVRVQCTIDIVEAGDVDIERDIDVWLME
jgi:hypothetical protein